MTHGFKQGHQELEKINEKIPEPEKRFINIHTKYHFALTSQIKIESRK